MRPRSRAPSTFERNAMTRTRLRQLVHLLAFVLLCFGSRVQKLSAQGTAFTYQGRLADSGSPASGNFDLRFAVFDALSGGTQQGASLTFNPVGVSAGVFSVQLDFGAIFT